MSEPTSPTGSGPSESQPVSQGSRGGFWIDRPVFVTGASGFLGGHLVRRLLDAGASVACLVRDWIPESELVRSGYLERVRIVRGDLVEPGLLERVMAEYEVDTVFHLAAQTVVGIANANPLSTFESNIRGTWLLLEACRRNPGVRQVVIASSDKAYGDHDRLPYLEEMPLQGRHPYDVSKSCADLLARSHAITFGLNVAITRCANLFGGGDLNWNRLFPGTIRSVLRGQSPIVRSDGNYVRDYLYVQEAADAYMLLAEAMSSRPELRGEAFNFSTEQGLTVLQIVRMILAVMGSNLKPTVLNQATNEIRSQQLSASKARKILGWRPDQEMEPCVKITVDWYRALLGERQRDGLRPSVAP